jgi:hypothetical protein
MKKLVFISSLLIVMMFVWVSCGSNDPTPTPVQKQILQTWTIPVKGFAGSSITLPATQINLSDIQGIDANNFISGVFQNTGGYIEISGLNKMDSVVLNNFSMQVNSTAAVNFGTVKVNPGPNDFGSDVQQSGNKEISFLNALFTAYTGKSKTATLTVTFTPSGDIVASDNVNLIIGINGQYNWNTYPN